MTLVLKNPNEFPNYFFISEIIEEKINFFCTLNQIRPPFELTGSLEKCTPTSQFSQKLKFMEF